MSHSFDDNPSGQEEFRDHLATIDEKGKRLWVYAKLPKGKYTTFRHIVGIILLILFFWGPFIKISGKELLLLNFFERKFVIFGMQFWPQDFHLFFLGMLTLIVFVIVLTVTYGRVWCGWTCPQTLFMEIIFRRIEYWIEGNPAQQRKLDQREWDSDKTMRKALKHFVFYAISFIIANITLAYFIGINGVLSVYTDHPFDHLGKIFAILVLSAFVFFVYVSFREQICTTICPYGRLQGVLLDRNSIVVTYDYKRGEKRGKLVKDEDRGYAGKGHCVDCSRCVQVCPTGIDIRNGTQLECINCAACIDACNKMMKSVNFPKGLIRHTSAKLIEEGSKIKFNARIIAYSVVLVVLVGLMSYFLFTRSDIETTILRAPGMLYQEQPDGRISNLYNIKILNKTSSDIHIKLKLISHKGEIQIIGDKIFLSKESLGEAVFFVYLDKIDVSSSKENIQIGIFADGEMVEEITTSFLGQN